MSDTQKKEYTKSIGGVWIKKDRNNNDFISGMLEHNGETIRFILRKNPFKKEDRHPTYHVFADAYVPKSQQAPAPTAKPVAAAPKLVAQPVAAPEPSLEDGEITL